MTPIRLLLCACLAGTLVSARDCRLLFLQRPQDAPGKARLHLTPEKSTEVELPRLNLSPRYPLPEGELQLTLGPLDGAAAGAPTVRVPAATGDCYLILVADPDNKVFPARIELVDAAMPSFSPGGMLWFNTTKTATVGGTLGRSRVHSKPGSVSVVKPPASKPESYPVALGFTLPGDSQPRPLCRTAWQHLPESRHLVFVVMDPSRRNVPRLLSVEDKPPAAPAGGE